MKPPRARVLAGLALAALAGAGVIPAPASPPASVARVGPGALRALYAPAPGVTEIALAAFLLDRRPVTNGEFLAFVTAHPDGLRWRRGTVPRLLAGDGYLARWAGPLSLGPEVEADQPVTHVSWFAAKAYCASQAKRLPTEMEWELAAAAGQRGPDGRAEERFQERLLAAYNRPAPKTLALVGRGPANYWGVHDLHGLVWEWVLDYNSTLVSSDSRGGKGADRLPFCGVGGLAVGAKDDYAGFMRFAFRSALEARYTTATLGFRCARDAPEPGR